MRMRGFTLIELLVVIVIIAILAAFLFPVYNKVMAEGAKRACTANLHQIAVALGQYYQDHHAYPPSPWDGAAYNSYGGLVALTKSNLSLPMLCKEDERAASDFVDGVAFSYAYDFEGRNPNVPADIQDRLLYNFWGYTPEGYEATRALYYDVAQSGGAVPPPVRKWTEFPFLVNSQAPKTAIITHCPFHRMGDDELVLRLDGSVKAIPRAMQDEESDVTRWEAEGKWPTQPAE